MQIGARHVAGVVAAHERARLPELTRLAEPLRRDGRHLTSPRLLERHALRVGLVLHDVVQHEAEVRGVSFEEAWARQVSSVAAKRFGTPTEFGKTCAFVCSAHAGYMSGTNLHLEGGSYTGIV